MIKSKRKQGFYIKKGIKIRFRTKKGTVLNVNRILLCLAILILATVIVIGFIIGYPRYKDKSLSYVSGAIIGDKVEVKEIENNNEEVKEETQMLVNDSTTNDKDKQDEKVQTTFKETNKGTRLKYRMTSYYTGDGTGSGATTASGKSTKDFQVNEKGWYTYQGKLVVATASKRLLSWEKYKNSKQRFFKLYDELILVIDGKEYEAIVLDVCGAAMKKPIIDLFVSNKSSVKDTQIEVIIK